MAALRIPENSIPSLKGKTAIVTGGASGIGLATARLLARQGATVHALDISEPPKDDDPDSNIRFRKCDVSVWAELRSAFTDIGVVDLAFANAGAVEKADYFTDVLDEDGQLCEPDDSFHRVLDVNVRGTIYFVKLAWSTMRKNGTHGSIVLTTSCAGYAPEQSLPVYSSSKFAHVGLIRALRSVLLEDNITINGVAPTATLTGLLSEEGAAGLKAMGVPVSTADHVARALIFSATATQERRVYAYGKDKEADKHVGGERWNGRVILTVGESYSELEEPTADLRPWWFGRDNERLTRLQQAVTDTRSSVQGGADAEWERPDWWKRQ